MIEVSGTEDLVHSFARLRGDLANEPELLADVATRVQRDARALAPKRTGALASSIGITRINRGVAVRTSLVYAQFVHYGSIHNPRPVPFLDIAARRADAHVAGTVGRKVDTAIGRAGL